MWPWGHLAVGYLCYSIALRLTDRQPSALGVVALAFGTQFPDLVDKPLAWTVHLLPNGRSLAHSVIVASGIAVTLVILSRHLDRQPNPQSVGTDGGRSDTGPALARHSLVPAFVLGYGSHLFADALSPLVHGDVAELAFLLWPVLPPVQYSGPGSFAGHFAAIEVTPFLLAEFVLVGLALLAWYADGLPGVTAVRRRIHR